MTECLTAWTRGGEGGVRGSTRAARGWMSALLALALGSPTLLASWIIPPPSQASAVSPYVHPSELPGCPPNSPSDPDHHDWNAERWYAQGGSGFCSQSGQLREQYSGQSEWGIEPSVGFDEIWWDPLSAGVTYVACCPTYAECHRLYIHFTAYDRT